MKRSKTAFLSFLVLLAGIWVYSMEKDPHAFKQSECVNCHQVDSSGKVSKQTTAPVIMICKKCHEDIFSKGYMHPVNVKPRTANVPKDMPLSSSGEINCATCHNMHGQRMTPYGTKSNYLRRLESGKRFCETCHKSGIGTQSHKAALGEAHFNAKYVVTDPSQQIDPISKDCISCHDGSFSSSVMAAGAWQHGKDFMKFDKGEHPIGVDYEQARSRRGSRADLKPIGAVDRRLRFFNGKVGCGTCHDPYSTLEKKLVMSDSESKLCFSCHSMGRK
ncbi:MAG: cytochrome c3 family protein [Nitrospirae bacterium]|nr:cytochrome c3 family protein [Nitrospirota bacterium]